jgi:hypothetical protein
MAGNLPISSSCPLFIHQPFCLLNPPGIFRKSVGIYFTYKTINFKCTIFQSLAVQKNKNIQFNGF